MGIELAKAWITVRADQSKLAGDFQKVKAKATGMAAGVASTVRGAMASFGVLAGVGAFVQLLRSGEEFNQKMRQSLAIMGDVSKTLRGKMKMAAFETARATKFSAAEAAESYFFLASAGLTAQQSIAAMPAVAQFAQAGMFNLSRATSLAANAQSALGLAVKDPAKNLENLTRVTDNLVKANVLADATVLEFAQALTNKAAAAAKTVGMEIEEVTAVLAAFAAQGTKGQRAGNAFNIVLRDLQTQALNNKAAFQKFNVAVFEGGKLRKIADIVSDLEQALGPMEAEMKKAALQQLGFADRSAIFIQTLLGSSEKIRQFEKELKKAGGTTKEVAAKQLTPLQKGMAKIGAAFTQVAVIAMNVIGPMIQVLGEVIVPVLGLAAAFVTYKLSVLAATRVTSLKKTAILGLKKSLFGLRTAVLLTGAAFRTALVLTGVGAILVVIGGAVAGIMKLVKWLMQTEAVQKALTVSTNNFSAAWEWTKEIFALVAKAFFTGLNSIAQWLGELVGVDVPSLGDSISEMAGNAIIAISSFAKAASRWILAVLQNWKLVWDAMPSVVKLTLSYLWDMVSTFFTKTFPQAVGFGIRKTVDLFIWMTKKIIRLIWNLLVSVVMALAKLPEMIWDAISGVDIGNVAAEGIKAAWKSLGSFTKGLKGEAPNFGEMFIPSERTKRIAKEELGEVFDAVTGSYKKLGLKDKIPLPGFDEAKKETAKGKGLPTGSAAAAAADGITETRLGFADWGTRIQDLLLKDKDKSVELQTKMVGLLEKGNTKQDEMITAIKDQDSTAVLGSKT